jgi:hypothetical protein
MRNYSPTNGTVDLYTVYGASMEKNKTLKELGFTYATAKDNWPCFAGYWEARGWDTADFLNLFFIEASWNDAVWAYDTVMGMWGYYRPGSWVTQSRAWIKAPDGWFRLNFGCMTGLGRYSGKLAQVWSDQAYGTSASTPGTAFEINHAGWLTKYQQDRVCLNSTAWGKDYGIIGGLAYTEGIIVENFRFVGGMAGKPKDTSFYGSGITLNEPGENSVIRECMSCDHNSAGYTVFNGTPFHIDTCSAFTNKDCGFDLLGSNGLCNLTIITPSGDDNPALIRIRPKDSQSVGGGTINISGLKSESRTVLQRPISVEGNLGDLNLTINGLTGNFDGPVCPELIRIEKGNQWQVDAHGVDLRSNTQSLLYHVAANARLTGGKPYAGNSFCVNDEGLTYKSRPSMAWSGASTPVDPVTPPTTGMTLTFPAGMPVGTDQFGSHPANLAVDNNANTYALTGRSMQVGDEYIFAFSSRVVKGLTCVAPAYYQNSWARKYSIYAWVNSAWVKMGSYTGAFTATATFPDTTTTQLKMRIEEANSNWWGCSNATLS